MNSTDFHVSAVTETHTGVLFHKEIRAVWNIVRKLDRGRLLVFSALQPVESSVDWETASIDVALSGSLAAKGK